MRGIRGRWRVGAGKDGYMGGAVVANWKGICGGLDIFVGDAGRRETAGQRRVIFERNVRA